MKEPRQMASDDSLTPGVFNEFCLSTKDGRMAAKKNLLNRDNN
jgi:hypothetical protein